MVTALRSGMKRYLKYFFIYPFAADMYNAYHTTFGEKHFVHLDNRFYMKPDAEIVEKRKSIVEVVGAMIGCNKVERKDLQNVFAEGAIYEDAQVRVSGKSELMNYFDHNSYFGDKNAVAGVKYYYSDHEICIVYHVNKLDNGEDSRVLPSYVLATLDTADDGTEQIVSLQNNWFSVPVLGTDTSKFFGFYCKWRRRLNALLYLDMSNFYKLVNGIKNSDKSKYDQAQVVMERPKPKRAVNE